MLTRFKPYLDPIDMWFVLLNMAGYAAFVTWAELIVRAIRGEQAEEGWRLWSSTAALIAARTLLSGARVRETATLRAATVELRGLVGEAAVSEWLRNEREEARHTQEPELRSGLYRLTKRLVVLAALTLAAAVVTLVVAIVA